jgi:hypothetical protein
VALLDHSELKFVMPQNLLAPVLAEVKHQGARKASELARVMQLHYVSETRFSKYCMGVSLLYPDVKHDKFKAKQRLVECLTR